MALRVTLRRALVSVALIGLALLLIAAKGTWLSKAEPAEAPASSLLAPALSGLNSSNAFERANAVKALHVSGSPAAVPALLNQLDDPDQEVGLYVAQALGDMAAPADLPRLEQALTDSNPDVRWRAAMALGKLRATSAVPELGNLLRDGDPLVQSTAGEALAQIGTPAAVKALVNGLDSRQPATVQAAMSGLEKIGSPAVSALTAALNSEQATARENAATVLGYIADPQARPALQLATIDQDPEVRAAVEWALDQLPG